jgi:hypothetical protein
MAISRFGTERALADAARAGICLFRNMQAPLGGHLYPEMIPLGENLHSQQIGPLAPCHEVKGFLG